MQKREMTSKHYDLTELRNDGSSIEFDDFDWYDEGSNFVCLPCSKFDVVRSGKSKWEIVREHFEDCKISNFTQLRDAISDYNEEAAVMHDQMLIDIIDEPEDEHYFFSTLLPRIGKLALRLPYLFNRIPLLRKGQQVAVTMTQEQAACLLANGFLCTIPSQGNRRAPRSNSSGASNSKFNLREKIRKDREDSGYPVFSFVAIFSRLPQSNKAKLKCILHYFDRVFARQDAMQSNSSLRDKRELNSLITFERRVLHRKMKWTESGAQFTSLHVENQHAIEDSLSAEYMCNAFDKSVLSESANFCAWQADFANKFLGGGVLNSGCVQEEILFVIYPECLLSMLFTQVLTEKEALLIRGAQRFANYDGYGHSFRFKSEYFDSTFETDLFYQRRLQAAAAEKDETQSSASPSKDDQVKFDRFGRRNTLIFAIDATPFGRNYAEQFREKSILRELSKFFVGVCRHDDLIEEKSSLGSSCADAESIEVSWLDSGDPIVTGNWGCGAFGGEKQLKAVIQLCAAAQCGRPIVYCTFQDAEFGDRLRELHRLLLDSKVTVKQVLRLIATFSFTSSFERSPNAQTLLEFLAEKVQSYSVQSSSHL